MTDADVIAALPGGADLQALVDQVHALQPDTLRGIAQNWQDAAGQLQTHTGNVAAALRKTGDTWQGPARDAYAGYMQPFDTASSQLESMLTSAGNDLANMADGLTTAVSDVDQIYQGLLTEAPTLDQPSLVIGQPSSSAADAVGAATEQVQQVIDQRITPLLSSTAASISGYPDEVTAGFATLAAPDGTSFPGQYQDSAADAASAPSAGQSPADGADGQADDTADVAAFLNLPDTAPASAPVATTQDVVASGPQSDTSSSTPTSSPALIDHNANAVVHPSHHPADGGTSPTNSDSHAHSGNTPQHTDSTGQSTADATTADSTTMDGSSTPPGQVGDWINQAVGVLEQNGVPASQLNPADIALIIQHESGGDPNSVNNYDSNAAAGHPSEGLMQTIQPTFNQYSLPGHGDIFNPVDNIIAGVRYAISRYGSISNVPGVVAVADGGSYVGY